MQELHRDADFHHPNLLCRHLLPQRLYRSLDPWRPLLRLYMLYSATLLVDQALKLAVDGLVQPGAINVLRCSDHTRLQLGRIDSLHAHYGQNVSGRPTRHLGQAMMPD